MEEEFNPWYSPMRVGGGLIEASNQGRKVDMFGIAYYYFENLYELPNSYEVLRCQHTLLSWDACEK